MLLTTIMKIELLKKYAMFYKNLKVIKLYNCEIGTLQCELLKILVTNPVHYCAKAINYIHCFVKTILYSKLIALKNI